MAEAEISSAKVAFKEPVALPPLAGAPVSVISASKQQPSAVADGGVGDFFAYARDFAERSVLFWDVIRQRADNFLEHERLGLPALLDFKWEMLLDARTFERQANYALLRITEAEGCRAAVCVDEDKPPVLIVDPRAGHGPGIGGF